MTLAKSVKGPGHYTRESYGVKIPRGDEYVIVNPKPSPFMTFSKFVRDVSKICMMSRITVQVNLIRFALSAS